MQRRLGSDRSGHPSTGGATSRRRPAPVHGGSRVRPPSPSGSPAPLHVRLVRLMMMSEFDRSAPGAFHAFDPPSPGDFILLPPMMFDPGVVPEAEPAMSVPPLRSVRHLSPCGAAPTRPRPLVLAPWLIRYVLLARAAFRERSHPLAVARHRDGRCRTMASGPSSAVRSACADLSELWPRKPGELRVLSCMRSSTDTSDTPS